MTEGQTEQVKVNLVPVLATLEKLADDRRVITKAGGHFNGHCLRIPENFPVDFMDTARSAAKYAAGLPKDHPHREFINPSKVCEGYDLLESGEVTIFYAGKSESFSS